MMVFPDVNETVLLEGAPPDKDIRGIARIPGSGWTVRTTAIA
jgi:hypothetical protein